MVVRIESPRAGRKERSSPGRTMTTLTLDAPNNAISEAIVPIESIGDRGIARLSVYSQSTRIPRRWLERVHIRRLTQYRPSAAKFALKLGPADD